MIIKSLRKISSHLVTNGIEEHQATTTPREQWQNKERGLKIKFALILFLTHSLWFLSLSGDEKKIPLKTTPQLAVEENHRLMQIPAQSYIISPLHGRKEKVSIVINGEVIFRKAFLRSVRQNSKSPSGYFATIEIPKNQIESASKYEDSIWHLYPLLEKKRLKTKERPYEVTI